MQRRLFFAASALLNLAFPPACGFCLQNMPTATEPFCADCQSKLVATGWTGCRRCAAPLSSPNCPHCLRRKYAFDCTLPLGPYEGDLKEAVLRSKQAGHEPLTLGMGRLMGDLFRESRSGPPLDLAVPVPMHWLRHWNRGVHGAALLAEAAARVIKIPCRHRLRCRRHAKKQGMLGLRRRFHNVRGVFGMVPWHDLRNLRVLLVDDVMATGATVGEAARVLKRAGAKEVVVLVAARGTGDGHSSAVMAPDAQIHQNDVQ